MFSKCEHSFTHFTQWPLPNVTCLSKLTVHNVHDPDFLHRQFHWSNEQFLIFSVGDARSFFEDTENFLRTFAMVSKGGHSWWSSPHANCLSKLSTHDVCNRVVPHRQFHWNNKRSFNCLSKAVLALQSMTPQLLFFTMSHLTNKRHQGRASPCYGGFL